MKSKTSGTDEWVRKTVNIIQGRGTRKQKCLYDCGYCYARFNAHRWKMTNWYEWAFMEKIEINEYIVNKGWRKPSNSPKNMKYQYDIMFPSAHDIFPQIIEPCKTVTMNIVKGGYTLLIVTKANPVAIFELADHLKEYKDQITWRISITTLDETIRKTWERKAPKIFQRLTVLKQLFADGWSTSVSIEPFLDRDPIPLIQEVLPYTNEKIWIGPMNLNMIILGAKKLWSKEMDYIYSNENLLVIKKEIDKLNNPKILLKDAFRHRLQFIENAISKPGFYQIPIETYI